MKFGKRLEEDLTYPGMEAGTIPYHHLKGIISEIVHLGQEMTSGSSESSERVLVVGNRVQLLEELFEESLKQGRTRCQLFFLEKLRKLQHKKEVMSNDPLNLVITGLRTMPKEDRLVLTRFVDWFEDLAALKQFLLVNQVAVEKILKKFFRHIHESHKKGFEYLKQFKLSGDLEEFDKGVNDLDELVVISHNVMNKIRLRSTEHFDIVRDLQASHYSWIEQRIHRRTELRERLGSTPLSSQRGTNKKNNISLLPVLNLIDIKSSTTTTTLSTPSSPMSLSTSSLSPVISPAASSMASRFKRDGDILHSLEMSNEHYRPLSPAAVVEEKSPSFLRKKKSISVPMVYDVLRPEMALLAAIVLPLITFTVTYRRTQTIFVDNEQKTPFDLKGYFLSASFDRPPASCYGAQGLSLTIFCLAVVIMIQHKIVKGQLKGKMAMRHRISLTYGLFSCWSAVGVATWPHQVSGIAHNTYAVLFFVCAVIHIGLESMIDYYHNISPKWIIYIRIFLSCLTVLCCISFVTYAYQGSHSERVQKSGVKDFDSLWISAISEIVMFLGLLSYFITYVPNFMHYEIELKVRSRRLRTNESSHLHED